jgi:hypothetical protein
VGTLRPLDLLANLLWLWQTDSCGPGPGNRGPAEHSAYESGFPPCDPLLRHSTTVKSPSGGQHVTRRLPGVTLVPVVLRPPNGAAAAVRFLKSEDLRICGSPTLLFTEIPTPRAGWRKSLTPGWRLASISARRRGASLSRPRLPASRGEGAPSFAPLPQLPLSELIPANQPPARLGNKRFIHSYPQFSTPQDVGVRSKKSTRGGFSSLWVAGRRGRNSPATALRLDYDRAGKW